MKEKEMKKQADIDWENRTLCSDESCIGVIGPDGRCKECGKLYEGEVRENDAGDQEDYAFEPEADTVDDDENDFGQPEEEDALDEDENDDTDWESRTLCSDESCIGVVGPDGRCKECGKPYGA